MKNYVIWGYVILLFLLPLVMPVFGNQKAPEMNFQEESNSSISQGEKRIGKQFHFYQKLKAKRNVDGMVMLGALKIYGFIFAILFEIFVRWR